MSLKNSKSMNILKDGGWNKLALHFFNKAKTKINKNSVFIILRFYPRLILTKTQYKTFKLARKHFNENYKNIIAISPMFFVKNLKKHIAWIESSEFHKQYGHMLPLEMKQLLMQSYDNNSNTVTPPPRVSNIESIDSKTFDTKNIQINPPLLNPNNIDCNKISNLLAWELNIPIPKNFYKLMLVSFGVSGHAALSQFLGRCGMVRADYMYCFNRKQDDSILWIDSCWIGYEKPSQKALAIMHKEKFFMLVRDPISRIKSIINHGGFKNRSFEKNITFSMATEPCVALDRHGYRDVDDSVDTKPIATSKFIDHMISNVWSFAYYSNISHLPLNSNIDYLCMQELAPSKAFDTITKLAHEFGFSPPKEDERGFYEEIKYGEFVYILPLVCVVDLQNGDNVCINIATKYVQSEKNVNEIIFDTHHKLLEKVSFSMSEGDLKALMGDEEILDKVRIYMKKFLLELQKRTDYIKRNKKSENDVLEIFKGDRELCKKFKTMLDRELTHIKIYRPDIIASWKYYQEFEKICRERDST